MGMFLSLPTMESVKHQNYELEVRLRRSSSSPYAAFVAYNEGGAVMGVDPISQFGKPKGYSRWALME